MRKGYPILVLLASLALISCNKNRIFEKNITIQDRIWHKDSVIQFQFHIEDIYSGYRLFYNIRNTNLYPYHNLYLQYTLEDTLGNVINSDLNEVFLFDAKTGKPLGDGMGDIFDNRFTILDDYHFDNPGIYRFKIKQYMRMEHLPEIMAVGLRVEVNPIENTTPQ